MRHAVRFTSAVLGFILGWSAYIAATSMFYRTEANREMQTLKCHVDALEGGPLGTVSLATPSAGPTEDTEYVIAQGKAGVPFLIEALKQEDKPNAIRYAAYCLRRMHSNKGKEAAANIYAKLAAKEVLNIVERGALRELRLYLEDVDS